MLFYLQIDVFVSILNILSSYNQQIEVKLNFTVSLHSEKIQRKKFLYRAVIHHFLNEKVHHILSKIMMQIYTRNTLYSVVLNNADFTLMWFLLLLGRLIIAHINIGNTDR